MIRVWKFSIAAWFPWKFSTQGKILLNWRLAIDKRTFIRIIAGKQEKRHANFKNMMVSVKNHTKIR